MYSKIHIENYRGLSEFGLEGLGRVNLLVGTNNCGKTSILEAIRLLAVQGDPRAIWSSLDSRSELVIDQSRSFSQLLYDRAKQGDICRLFHGHNIRVGSKLSISGDTDDEKNQRVELKIEASNGRSVDYERFGPLMLSIYSGDIARHCSITVQGGLPLSEVDRTTEIDAKHEQLRDCPFISTEAASSDFISSMWNKIALRPEEQLIVNALKVLEPRVEAVRVVNASYFQGRSNVIVKMEGVDAPIPIGSMGEGMWRMLALAMAISTAKGGYFFVDEIDTGLHYSVMRGMWRMIAEQAKALNVQVFSTTHSYDCVSSLAAICTDSKDAHDVSIQNIDSRQKLATMFTEQEIIRAAESGIEVR